MEAIWKFLELISCVLIIGFLIKTIINMAKTEREYKLRRAMSAKQDLYLAEQEPRWLASYAPLNNLYS